MPYLRPGGACDFEGILRLVTYTKAIVGHTYIEETAPAVVQSDAGARCDSPQQGPGLDSTARESQVVKKQHRIVAFSA